MLLSTTTCKSYKVKPTSTTTTPTTNTTYLFSPISAFHLKSNPQLRRQMGGDVFHRRSSYLSGCMSPSCVPVHEEYSRIDISQEKGHRSRRLRKLLRKIVNESKSIYGSPKPLTFQYDAVSYSQNFDDGCHRDDEYPRCQQVFQDFRWQQHVVQNK